MNQDKNHVLLWELTWYRMHQKKAFRFFFLCENYMLLCVTIFRSPSLYTSILVWILFWQGKRDKLVRAVQNPSSAYDSLHFVFSWHAPFLNSHCHAPRPDVCLFLLEWSKCEKAIAIIIIVCSEKKRTLTELPNLGFSTNAYIQACMRKVILFNVYVGIVPRLSLMGVIHP